MAGLSEVCTHVAAVLFFVETAARVNGADTCTHNKCQWIIPTFQKNIPYLPVNDIDFTSTKAKKRRIDNFSSPLPSSSLVQINAISDSLSLKQIVTQPTHFSVFASPSLIDLVFVPSTLVILLLVLPSPLCLTLIIIVFYVLFPFPLPLPLLLLFPSAVSGYMVLLTSHLLINFFHLFLGLLSFLLPMLILLGWFLNMFSYRLCILLFPVDLYLLLFIPLG